MILSKKQIPTLFYLCGILALASCGSVNQKVVAHQFTTDISGLDRVNNDEPTMIYIRPGAAPLSSYGRFIIDPVRVDYNDPSVKELSPADIKKMQDFFYESMTSEFNKHGHAVVTRSQDKTMRISFVISAVKTPKAAANITSVLIPVAFSLGEVTVEATFSDALSKEITAVVVNSSKGSRLANATPWSTWADVESSFDNWAKGIADAIDAK